MTVNTEIVQAEPTMSLGIIPARTPHDVIVQATIIAKELAGIVKANKLSNVIQGRQFVKVEGWSTMGAMLGVLPREMPELFKSFEDGSCEATVELIRISDGAVIGRGSAFVGMDERDRKGQLTWGSRPMYARRSMAVTRATGKAYRLGFSWIMALAGYEATPAEEMEGVMDADVRVIPEEHDAPMPDNGNIAVIPLETAMNVTTSDGLTYGSLSDEDLRHRLLGIKKALTHKDITLEQREEYEYKRSAAVTILNSRQPAQ